MTEKVGRADDEAQIRAVIEDWARALRAKDVDGVLAPFAADIVISPRR